jgi:hypothetical protein
VSKYRKAIAAAIVPVVVHFLPGLDSESAHVIAHGLAALAVYFVPNVIVQNAEGSE